MAYFNGKEIWFSPQINIGGSSGGVVINNQDMVIKENGTYTADSGYTGLGTITVDVETGGSTGGTGSVPKFGEVSIRYPFEKGVARLECSTDTDNGIVGPDYYRVYVNREYIRHYTANGDSETDIDISDLIDTYGSFTLGVVASKSGVIDSDMATCEVVYEEPKTLIKVKSTDAVFDITQYVGQPFSSIIGMRASDSNGLTYEVKYRAGSTTYIYVCDTSDEYHYGSLSGVKSTDTIPADKTYTVTMMQA